MTIAAIALLGYLATRLTGASPAVPQSRDFGCTEWHQCREMALAAAERGEYETFHDLAWRAVQTGPKNDPALMYLLARAQALSGRAHDALVMLNRLADMGAFSDVATNDDFAQTRQLPGWSELAARIEQLKQNAPAAPRGTVSRRAAGRARAASTPPVSIPPAPPAESPGTVTRPSVRPDTAPAATVGAATAAAPATERPADFTPAP